MFPVHAWPSVDSANHNRPNRDVEGTDKIQRKGIFTRLLAAFRVFVSCFVSVEKATSALIAQCREHFHRLDEFAVKQENGKIVQSILTASLSLVQSALPSVNAKLRNFQAT